MGPEWFDRFTVGLKLANSSIYAVLNPLLSTSPPPPPTSPAASPPPPPSSPSASLPPSSPPRGGLASPAYASRQHVGASGRPGRWRRQTGIVGGRMPSSALEIRAPSCNFAEGTPPPSGDPCTWQARGISSLSDPHAPVQAAGIVPIECQLSRIECILTTYFSPFVALMVSSATSLVLLARTTNQTV